MDSMPAGLRSKAEALAEGMDLQTLTREAAAVSEAYRTRTGEGKRLVTDDAGAAAYACARMPATYAAARRALSCSCPEGEDFRTILDCGAGTGAMTLAALSLFAPDEATCLEREAAMRRVGEQLTADAVCPVRWAAFDMRTDQLPRAELVMEGYMLGELAEEERVPAALRLWEAAERMLLLVEPGTPQGYRNLMAVRAALLERGAHTAAPCAGDGACGITDSDWCHFSARVERTKLMKRLKGGDAPFEDEKFCFLALTREQRPAAEARILRHPQVDKGRVTLTLCTASGIETRSVTKKDPLWKRARKAQWGETI